MPLLIYVNIFQCILNKLSLSLQQKCCIYVGTWLITGVFDFKLLSQFFAVTELGVPPFETVISFHPTSMFRLGCTLGSINGWVPQTWRIPTSPFQGSGAKFVEEGQKMSEVFFIFRGWPPQKGRRIFFCRCLMWKLCFTVWWKVLDVGRQSVVPPIRNSHQ